VTPPDLDAAAERAKIRMEPGEAEAVEASNVTPLRRTA